MSFPSVIYGLISRATGAQAPIAGETQVGGETALLVKVVNASSGGGTADSTAANQVLQLAQETAIAGSTSTIATLTGGVLAAVQGTVKTNSQPPNFSAAPVIVSLASNASGASYVTFGSQAGSALQIVNATGTKLEVRRGGSGSTLLIPDGGSYLITNLTNANEVQYRRADSGATVVTLTGEMLP